MKVILITLYSRSFLFAYFFIHLISELDSFDAIPDTEIWHGDTKQAFIVNNASNWPGYELWKMFDSDPNTSWHSQRGMLNKLKMIGIHFKVS